MATKPDLKALRALPYLTAVIVAITHLSAAFLCALAIKMVVLSDNGAYNFIGIFISYSTSIKYIAMIGLFICLYRLSGVTKWFYYSWVSCIVYIVAGLFTQLVAWLTTITDENIAAVSLSFILSLLPDASIFFAIYALIRGSEEIYTDIDIPEGKRKAARCLNLWIFSEAALLSSYYLLFTVCALARRIFQFNKGGSPLPLCITSYVLTVTLTLAILIYIYAAVKVVKVVRGTCYDFYLHIYNNKL